MSSDIAVVGLSARFPGAPSAEEFWSLVRDGRSGLTRLSAADSAANGVPASLARHPHYVPIAGIIEGQSHFDAAAWGLTKAEASTLDPQHRILMDCAWHALEDSGHGHGRGAGAVGVFVGSTQSAYLAHNLAGRWDSTGTGRDPLGSMEIAIGTQPDYLPLRIAYRLGLTGPAIAVSTSCSTSLVAVHLAAQSLLSGECDTAIAGGVSAIVPQGRGYLYVEGGVFSRDGEIAPFGARGSGIVYTQGAGAVVLRRLDDAVAERDVVLAVLRGSAVNNDGTDKAGFTAPSVRGQARVVAEAMAVSGAVPSDIGLIEAHGTATRLGDPIEIAALRTVFGQSGPPWCGLGSVKGNIGHTNSAAGIAAFIKAVLAIHHRTLPMSLGSDAVNDDLRLSDSPFALITRTRQWDTAPYAGVSSFGIGGTNAHVVLAPAPPLPTPVTTTAGPVLLVSSGATDTGARSTADSIAEFAATAGVRATDLAHTLARGRAVLPHRTFAVADPSHGQARPVFSEPVTVQQCRPSVIFAFPGAGGHFAGMGAEMYRDEPVFRAAVDEVAGLLTPLIGADVRDIFDREAPPERIRDVGFAVPALFAISLATARLLESWGLTPSATLGHSLGECTAAAFSGALSLRDACTLVAARCTAARTSAGAGGMMAVALSESDADAAITAFPGLDIAAANSPHSTVIAGALDELDSARTYFTAECIDTSMLRLDAAMHSRHVEPALDDVRIALKQWDSRSSPAPTTIVVSTVTGDIVDADTLRNPQHWIDQLRAPVRFSRALTTAVASGSGNVVVVEVGPGTALTGLTLAHAFPDVVAATATMNHDEPESITVRSAFGRVWSAGVPVDPAAPTGGVGRVVRAPGYRFDRQHVWIEPAESRQPSGEVSADEPLQVPVWRQTAWRHAPTPTDAPSIPTGRWWVAGTSVLAQGIARRLRAAGVHTLEDDEIDAETTGLDGVVCVGDDTVGTADCVDSVVRSVEKFASRVALGTPALAPTAMWVSVTRGAVRVTGDDRVNPAAAAVRALPRVLGQEQACVRWLSVDLADSSDNKTHANDADDIEDADDADDVFAELTAALDYPCESPAVDVALRADTRWTCTLASLDSASVLISPPAPSQPRPGTRALVVGGSGAVGRLLSEHLVDVGYDVVATSRRPHADIVAGTGSVRFLVCDATDRTALTDLVRTVDSDGEPIGLVVHAAGVAATVAPQPLSTLSDEAIGAHLESKLGVAANIRAALADLARDRRPDTVLCMSSATGMLGGVGMGAYAAANTAMDAFAMTASTRTTTWISIVWDGWQPVLDRTESSVEASSVTAMSSALGAATGLDAFDRIRAIAAHRRPPAVVAVSTTDLAARSRTASIPRTHTADAPHSADGASMSPVEAAVAELWSELFGSSVRDPEADFFALGGHSLLGTRMLDAVHSRFGIRLGLKDLLALPTIREFASAVGECTTSAAPSESSSDTSIPALTDAIAADGTFAMTRVQHAYWIGRDGGYEWGNVPCHFYLEYDCVDLDLNRYGKALDAVIARHPLLRTVATPDGRLRTLDSVPPYRIRTRDLSNRDDDAVATALATTRRKISNEPGPADRWPLIQIAAAALGNGRVRLFIGVDVLVCDAASWWIIESELKTLYEDPHADLGVLDLHPAQCTAAATARRRGPRGIAAEQYWRARLDTVPGPPALPISSDLVGSPRFVRRATSLDSDTWCRFVRACRQRRVTPTAALLTVYTDSLRRWTATEHFSVILTLFDRPAFHPDVNRVVGDFTSLIVHESDRHRASSFLDRAAATQQRTFDDLDRREYSALEFLSEQSARFGERRAVPVVFTGALGVHDMVDDSGSLEWVGTQVHAVGQTPQTWLDHQVLEQDGRLRLQWDVLDGILPDDELDRVVDLHTRTVALLAEDPAAWESNRPDSRVVDPADVLVPLRTSPRADAPTLFLVHPSGGDVLCYAELSRQLRTDVSIVGITDPELTSECVGETSIESIAHQYISAIRAKYPTPESGWLLGGWSMGGSLAQEMARQLLGDGDHTALLAMLDSNDPAFITAIAGNERTRLTEVARRQLGALESFLDVDLDIGDEAWAEVAALSDPARRVAIAERLRSRRLLGPRDDGSSRTAVFDRHLAALADHTPSRLLDDGTRALLIRCTRVSPNNSGIGMGIDDTPAEHAVDLGWLRHLSAPVHVVDVDAHHYSVLRAPALDVVVAELDRVLRVLRVVAVP